METFDAIVVGLGAHGSAAAAALARRGLRVLGLERFARGEAMGSSGGRSRMIRIAHYEDPWLVPFAVASWEAWLALEGEADARILTPTGGLYGGPPGSALLEGSRAAASGHDLDHEILRADEIHARWPVLEPPDETIAVFESRAGLLRADRANAAHLSVAERDGADLRFERRLVDWRPAPGGGFEVETADGEVVGGDHLVLATGPWISGFVPDLRLPLTIEREAVAWFEPLVPVDWLRADRLPIWVLATPEHGAMYGVPYDDELGLKVSRHHQGVFVDPEEVDRAFGPADEARIRPFLASHLPGADGPVRTMHVCLYTNTPDSQFVIDRHPAAPGIAFASACSGHGFKFAPVIGEILADLAVDGATSWPVDAFRWDRFAGASPA
ncbi:MAG TPA: N-methyl-L-tryptophan oxidase [Candidatus Limnocylindrales bacterium]